MARLVTLKDFWNWILAGCRIFVGLIVAKTGVGLLQGEFYMGFNRQNDLLTGGFVVLIGAYIVFSTIISLCFPDKEP